MSTTCFTPDGHKRPVLNVNSKFLIYMWNVPNNVPISVIKRIGERVRFVETFEAWKGKKIGQLIIEFSDQQSLDKFVNALSQKEILNFDPPVEFRIYDPQFGTRSFFDYVRQWSGVDLLACQAIPESFDYNKKPSSNTTTRGSSSQLRASEPPFVPRTNINPPPATRNQNGTSNIQNENREFGAGIGMRQQSGGFGRGSSRRRGGGNGNGTSNVQNGNNEFGAGNGIRQQSGGFGGGSRRGRGGGSRIFMQSHADANISSNNQNENEMHEVSPLPNVEEEEGNLNGMAANRNDETDSPQFDRQQNGASEEEEVEKMPDEKTVNHSNDQNGAGEESDWSKEDEEEETENVPPNESTELVDRKKADSPQFNQYRQPKESWEEEEDKKTILIKKLKFGFDIEKIMETMQTYGDVFEKKKIDETEASFTFYYAEDARIAILQMQNGTDQWEWLFGNDATLQMV